MTTQQAVHQKLTGASAVSAIVGNRVFNTVTPQDVAAPFIRFQRLFSTSIADHDGTAAEEATYQVECWATTKAQAHALRKAVKGALDNQPLATGGSPTLEGTRDDFDTEAELYRCDADFLIFEGPDD